MWGRRLLTWFLLISLVPLILSNGVGYVRSQVIIERLVERFLGSIADLQAKHVGEKLAHLSRTLEHLAEHPDVAGAVSGATGPADITRALDRALAADPEFEAVYILDPAGTIVASSPLAPADIRLWIGPAFSVPLPAFEIQRDEDPPHYPYVRLSAEIPFESADGGRWHLGASVGLGGRVSFLDLPEHIAGSVETIILDREGLPVFVSHPHGHIDYGEPFETPLLGPGPRHPAAYPDRLGVEVLGTIVPVPGRPLRLVNEVPAAEALTDLEDLRDLSLWLATALILLVVYGAWATAGRIVSPVSRLLDATKRLASGESRVEVAPLGRDEIGELGSAFNDMVNELRGTSAEVEMLHRHELERAAQLATVGELAAGIAHEIKNPVVGISGGMDLIASRVPDDLELRRIIDEIRRQTSRIGRAVRDLLSFARPAEPHMEEIDVHSSIERANILTRAAAEQLSVAVEMELTPCLPAVRVDAEQLAQCLINLMINAIQAAGEGGSVVVRTRAADDGVEIDVADSGPGIEADQLDEIFRPFFTTKHRGTGLGLSITRDIVTRHGGRIDVETELSVGSVFTVWLPAVAPGVPAGRADTAVGAAPTR
jgi:signal transduction histidine kinase